MTYFLVQVESYGIRLESSSMFFVERSAKRTFQQKTYRFYTKRILYQYRNEGCIAPLVPVLIQLAHDYFEIAQTWLGGFPPKPPIGGREARPPNPLRKGVLCGMPKSLRFAEVRIRPRPCWPLNPRSPTPHKPDLNTTDAKRPDTSPPGNLCRGGAGGTGFSSLQSGGLGGDAPPSEVWANIPAYASTIRL